jgi:hypothetical protein
MQAEVVVEPQDPKPIEYEFPAVRDFRVENLSVS